MNILINCSNLKKGGGLQVADSVCCFLDAFPQHRFYLVLSSFMDATANKVKKIANVEVIRHDIRNDLKTLLLGKDKILDELVEDGKIDAVITVFGPARWIPYCPHICGFARAHLVLGNSPYFAHMGWCERAKWGISNIVMGYFFRRGVDVLFTENPYISEKLSRMFRSLKVETITNYYNQVFDEPLKKVEREYDGVTLLTVSAPYSHKNMAITVDVARILHEDYPDLKFRFMMTVTGKDLPAISKDLKKYFELLGSVDVSQCPSLYAQADICFQPTLLECFTATYVEAMKMKVPIVTTNLDFAMGLCGDAALYYEALNPQAAADAIYRVVTDKGLRNTLVENGHKQLGKFDDYKQRASKLVALAESIILTPGKL